MKLSIEEITEGTTTSPSSTKLTIKPREVHAISSETTTANNVPDEKTRTINFLEDKQRLEISKFESPDKHYFEYLNDLRDSGALQRLLDCFHLDYVFYRLSFRWMISTKKQ